MMNINLLKIFKPKKLTFNDWFNNKMGNDKKLTQYSGGGYEWIMFENMSEEKQKRILEEYKEYLKPKQR